jgi:hypothetical protein
MTDSNNDAAARRAARVAAERARLESEPRRKMYRHEDFLFDAALEAYWCVPTRTLHSGTAVDALVPLERWRLPMREGGGRPPAPIKPHLDIARVEGGLVVESSTWSPGGAQILEDVVATGEGLFPLAGARAFNTYRPGPVADTSLAAEAGPWVEHVKRLWPEPVEHGFFFDYCAHMIQHPEEKCNAAIVLSGKQGVGKDAALLPLRAAVGAWNARNVGPDKLLERFNPWVECLMLTVDEVRPTKDEHRATALYDALKTLIATPPDMLPLEQKGMAMRYILNRLRVFITTNDRLAMYIPPEDRRLVLLHTRLEQNWWIAEDDPDYFVRLFGWLHGPGGAAVAGWLAARDLSAFDANGPIPRTQAWAEISQRWDAPEDALTRALDMLGEPDVLLNSELTEQLFDESEELARMMRSRSFVHRMLQAGYRLVPLPPDQTCWRREHNGYQVKTNKIYIKEKLNVSDKEALEAARNRLQLRVEAGPSGAVPRTEARIQIRAVK